MSCRLPTIGRYNRERLSKKETSEARRQAERYDLAERVADLRNRNVAALCHVAEFVNRSAEETHEFLADRRAGRFEPRNTMWRELREYRARIRADMERIVSTDFM
ncbi:MAG: hypothetical protein AAGF88_05630 [Pseudomonadota bacterium]